MASAEALWRWLRQWRREHLQVDRVAVLRNVDEGGQLGPRYAFMTVMACGIATLGLLQNSVAVIIGAMLISPLMGPIVELGMSLATFDFRSLRESLKTLAVGTAVALTTATAIVLVSPLQEATPEILARTEPTLFDLLVAVFSGLAGAYATITRKGETIVGVAIATALMPPLATVGFGLATLNWTVFSGALLLFVTNFVAIALFAALIARLYGFKTYLSGRHTMVQNIIMFGVLVALAVAIVLVLSPSLVLRWLRARRIEHVEQQLPDALQMLAGTARAGLSLPAAIRQVSTELAPPLQQELLLVQHEQRLGVSLDDALENLARRIPAQPVKLMVSAMRIANETGGGLAETLERTATTLRSQHAMELKIRALTAQGKLQAWVVGLLPVFLLWVLHRMEPEAMAQLWTTQLGWGVLAAVIVMEFVGVLLIRRIVAIDI